MRLRWASGVLRTSFWWKLCWLYLLILVFASLRWWESLLVYIFIYKLILIRCVWLSFNLLIPLPFLLLYYDLFLAHREIKEDYCDSQEKSYILKWYPNNTQIGVIKTFLIINIENPHWVKGKAKSNERHRALHGTTKHITKAWYLLLNLFIFLSLLISFYFFDIFFLIFKIYVANVYPHVNEMVNWIA